jgi:pyrroloquinoline quinone biosynthesis protein B
MARCLTTCICAIPGAFLLLFLASAGPSPYSEPPFIVVLGIAQDAGYPQAGCANECCAAAWRDASLRRSPVSLAIVDPESGERWLIECTPDFPQQLHALDEIAPPENDTRGADLAGIFLTHAHIGHYAGLIHLGREVIGADHVPLHIMPRMKTFLETNGPWDQLVALGNIELREMTADEGVQLNERIAVTPFIVPHRDEYSETVGFRIDGPNRSILFIPDIDKWEKWDRRIEDVIAKVDVAYLDGTFYANGEIPGRDMAEIPHPFIEESLQRFSPLTGHERSKIRFIHLNHTNPALRAESAARSVIDANGMRVTEEGDREPL